MSTERQTAVSLDTKIVLIMGLSNIKIPYRESLFHSNWWRLNQEFPNVFNDEVIFDTNGQSAISEQITEAFSRLLLSGCLELEKDGRCFLPVGQGLINVEMAEVEKEDSVLAGSIRLVAEKYKEWISPDLTLTRVVGFIVSCGGKTQFSASAGDYHSVFYTIQQENGGELVGGHVLVFNTVGICPYSERLEEIIGTLAHTGVVKRAYCNGSPSVFGTAEVTEMLYRDHPDEAEAIMAMARRFSELIPDYPSLSH